MTTDSTSPASEAVELAKRLQNAANDIIGGLTIFSDKVYGLLTEAADMLVALTPPPPPLPLPPIVAEDAERQAAHHSIEAALTTPVSRPAADLEKAARTAYAMRFQQSTADE